MAFVFTSYWNFISRFADYEIPSGMQSLPNLYRDTAIWSVFFTIFMLAVPYAFKNLIFTKWFNSLDARKQVEFPPYFVSMFHHLTMVPIAWYYIYQDTLLEDYSHGTVDYSVFVGMVVPFCTGFIVGDTLCFAIFQALRGVPEYIIHHVLSLWMIFALLSAPGQLSRFFPHMLVCDTTNIFFNIAWLMRLAGYKGNAIVSFVEYMFALSFLLLRAVNLSIVMSIIFLSEPGQRMGISRFTLPPIVFLQWFWMQKIAWTALGLKKPAAKKHSDTGAVKKSS
ncbi:hypothetical protein EON65_39000 [archaeon]|nr:MAG: hypothetical protein EON65_39000 [archaeon]